MNERAEADDLRAMVGPRLALAKYAHLDAHWEAT